MGRWNKPYTDGRGHKLPQRMFPKFGGKPLPWPPIVAPGYSGDIAKLAAEYVKELDAELDAAVDEGYPKWSGSQRQYIRQLRAKWIVRAQGMDAHYKKFGTFPRPFNGDPPTIRDMVVERWRRREMDNGNFVSNAEHRRQHHRTRSRIVDDIVREWRRKYGDKKPKKQFDPHGE